MIIRFKSSKLESEEIVRSFNKDFEKSQLSEEEFTNFKKGNTSKQCLHVFSRF